MDKLRVAAVHGLHPAERSVILADLVLPVPHKTLNYWVGGAIVIALIMLGLAFPII